MVRAVSLLVPISEVVIGLALGFGLFTSAACDCLRSVTKLQEWRKWRGGVG